MSTTIEVNEQVVRVQAETNQTIEEIRALQIIDQVSMIKAVFFRDRLSGFIKTLKGLLDPGVEDAHQLHKRAVAHREAALTGPELALRLVKQKIMEAEKAEVERLKKEADAERVFQKIDVLRDLMEKHEKDQAWLEAFTKLPGSEILDLEEMELDEAIRWLQEEDTLETAIKMENQGMPAVGDILIASAPLGPTLPPPPSPERKFEKPKRSGYKTIIHVVVQDKATLIRAVAAGQVSQDALVPVQSFLNSLGKVCESIPGCRIDKRDIPL